MGDVNYSIEVDLWVTAPQKQRRAIERFVNKQIGRLIEKSKTNKKGKITIKGAKCRGVEKQD